MLAWDLDPWTVSTAAALVTWTGVTLVRALCRA